MHSCMLYKYHYAGTNALKDKCSDMVQMPTGVTPRFCVHWGDGGVGGVF